MTKAQWLALGASALALAGCNQAADNATAPANGSTAAAVAPPAGQDWTQVVSQTPEGGFVMGNPNAPVKLVEYLSLTCPHCAQFAETGYPQLQEYVKGHTEPGSPQLCPRSDRRDRDTGDPLRRRAVLFRDDRTGAGTAVGDSR
jgi:hypothetical protein